MKTKTELYFALKIPLPYPISTAVLSSHPLLGRAQVGPAADAHPCHCRQHISCAKSTDFGPHTQLFTTSYTKLRRHQMVITHSNRSSHLPQKTRVWQQPQIQQQQPGRITSPSRAQTSSNPSYTCVCIAMYTM